MLGTLRRGCGGGWNLELLLRTLPVAHPEANRIEMGGAELKFVAKNLYYGDCLDVLKGWRAGWVDLVYLYLDPPFNSKTNHNVLYGSRNSALGDGTGK